MKTLNIYLIATIIACTFFSCSEPNPTELTSGDTSNDEDFSVEMIAKDPANYDYSTGYDSTGITEPIPSKFSLISINGIKTSQDNTVDKAMLALAIFYDKNEPVRNSIGRVIGFNTKILGRVTFNDDSASVVPHRVKYFDRGFRKDTLLGFKHVLVRIDDENPFPYNSAVTFSLDPITRPTIQFIIPTPEEINGNVNVNGSRLESNLKFLLNWNGLNRGEIEIIIGGQNTGSRQAFPFYRIKTADDGALRIPAKLLSAIPFDQYDKVIVTFIRRRVKEFFNQEVFDNNFISAQSIHNVIFDVPD
ncbi:MAG: hypothetical protein V1720_06210 [bacterium]